MNTHTNQNVICIKDIPSNIIEEAIFILKPQNEGIFNSKISLERNEILRKETEELISEYSNEFEKIKFENETMLSKKKTKIIKSILVITLFSLIGILISIVK